MDSHCLTYVVTQSAHFVPHHVLQGCIKMGVFSLHSSYPDFADEETKAWKDWVTGWWDISWDWNPALWDFLGSLHRAGTPFPHLDNPSRELLPPQVPSHQWSDRFHC